MQSAADFSIFQMKTGQTGESQLTFGDKEDGGVEGGSHCGGGVNHTRLIDPFELAFLWMPLHRVEGVVVGWQTEEPQESF